MLGDLSAAQCEELLHTEVTGRVGTHSDSRTYIFPVTYAYQDGVIYVRTGEGMKVRLMQADPNVCFEIDQMQTLNEWKSVMVQGTYQELRFEEASKAMSIFYDRMRPLAAQQGPSVERGMFPEMKRAVQEGRSAIAFRITVVEMTGRFETA